MSEHMSGGSFTSKNDHILPVLNVKVYDLEHCISMNITTKIERHVEKFRNRTRGVSSGVNFIAYIKIVVCC